MATPTPRTARKFLRTFHLSTLESGTSPDWQEKSAAYWRDACRSWSFRGQAVKVAELGGSADTPFEQAFANLAHAYLRDKAPKLLEYEVGFQLIEKNQENTKAVGVFGFKVGDQWLYAPVFFLNGDLKGHELLYIKNQDIFVPLKDNWLNYLLGRKPSILGRTVDRNLSQLGVLPPNLQQLTRSPYKYASAAPMLADWFVDFLPALGHLATSRVDRLEKFAAMASLPEVLRAAGRTGVEFMMKVAQSYPTVFRAFIEYHGDEFRKLASEAAAETSRASRPSILKNATTWALGDPPAAKLHPASRQNGGVASYGRDAWNSLDDYLTRREAPYDQYVHPGGERLAYKSGSILGRLKKAAPRKDEAKAEVILREDIWQSGLPAMKLTPDERAKLVTDGRLVRDNRPASAVSKAYRSSTSMSLQNPDETNVYTVLVRPNKFEECLIIVGPYGERGHENYCTVISLEGEGGRGRWLNIHPSRVFVVSRYSREAWNKWYDGLDDADSLPVDKDRYNSPRVVLLGRGGQGTVPVQARRSYTSGGPEQGGKVYGVSFDEYCSKDTPYLYEPARSWPQASDRWSESRIDTIRLTGRAATEFQVNTEELQVPAGFKKFLVDRPASSGDDLCCSDDPGESYRPSLQPGNLEDVQLALMAQLVPMKLLAANDGVTIDDQNLTKDAAFRSLVVDWGFDAPTADALLETAARSPKRAVNVLVKKADPFLTRSAPGGVNIPEFSAGSDPMTGTGTPTRVMEEREERVPGMEPNAGDRDKYKPQGPDAGTMQVAQQAAQSGQREVFDTAMLGSLLKAVREDNMIDRYLGDLMKGMDRLGRIYFQFLWHGEEFEDRYGKQDLPELEDGLRNAFEACGDVILVLKRKSVEPFAEQGTDIDLSSVAN